MTRVEEARAERAREQANIDPFGLGVVMPEGFAVTDLDEDDKAEVKKEVKAEIMQDVENRFSELSAQLAEQKQRGSLEIDGEDILQSASNLQIFEDTYEREKLDKAKELKKREEELFKKEEELQRQRAEELRRKEEENRRNEEELKAKEEALKKQQELDEKRKSNKLRRFFLSLRIDIKNNFAFKFIKEVVIAVGILFVIFEIGYMWDAVNSSNGNFDFIESFLSSIDYIKGYIHLAIEQIPNLKNNSVVK